MSQIKIIMAASHINSSPAQAVEPNQNKTRTDRHLGVSILTLKTSHRLPAVGMRQ